MGMRRFYITAVLLVAAFGLVATATFAAMSPKESVGEQWRVAVEHSKLAQKADGMKGVQQHLQHIMNCLEGRGGGMFDASQGNPCEGKGNGMMVDAKSAGEKKYTAAMTWMELSGDVATVGMKAKTAAKAKAAAWARQMVLEQTGAVLR